MRHLDSLCEIEVVHPASGIPHPFYDAEEKRDILERIDWLCQEVIIDPQMLIDKMSEAIGR